MASYPRVSTEQIFRLTESHGYPAGAIKPIPTGHFNESYFVRTKRGPDLVVRIAPPPDAGFVFYERGMMAQEPEIHHIVRRRTDLPVPRIIAFDDSHEIIDRDVIVMERLPGKALAHSRLERHLMDSLMRTVGRSLRLLHENCRARQYGYLGAHAPMPPADRWADAFFEMWNRLIADLEGCGVYRPEDGDLAHRAMDRNFEVFGFSGPASLLHMDIWTQNLLVDEQGTLCGIIDWDRALWGDPEIEFAVLDYCGFDNGPFWEGYGERPLRTGEAGIRMRFYHLYEVLKYPIIWTRRGGGRGKVASYRDYGLSMLRELAEVQL